MTPRPLVVVPSFTGYVREADETDGAEGSGPAGSGRDAAERLQALWLGLVEGHDGPPGAYLVLLPEVGTLTRDLPPDGSLDALGKAFAARAEHGSLLCFAYDWRRDLTGSAARLGAELVEHAELLETKEVDLLGVGVGALLVRYLLESGALPAAAALVRRTVYVATPSRGLPAGLLLLARALGSPAPDVALRQVLDRFPAAVQLLPPRGTPYAYLLGSPGVRLDPFAWPDLLAPLPAHAARIGSELVPEAAERNDALHSRLRTAHHPSWRSALALVSASEPTFAELAVELRAGRPSLERVTRQASAGDGVVPVVGSVPGPGIRHGVVCGHHRLLLADPALLGRIAAFLDGPLA